MNDPVGCLTQQELDALAGLPHDERSNTRVFYVTRNGLINCSAGRHFGFNLPHTRYFHNYFLAYGYSLRMKEKQNAQT